MDDRRKNFQAISAQQKLKEQKEQKENKRRKAERPEVKGEGDVKAPAQRPQILSNRFQTDEKQHDSTKDKERQNTPSD